jgi:hypothetical protein
LFGIDTPPRFDMDTPPHYNLAWSS